MKLITAIVQPHRLAPVRDALDAIGVQGMTVSAASGFGRQRGHTEVYRGTEVSVDLIPKTRIEVLVTDATANVIAEAIISAAHTGQIGDGKVWIVPVEEVTRVRTGEYGPEAI